MIATNKRPNVYGCCLATFIGTAHEVSRRKEEEEEKRRKRKKNRRGGGGKKEETKEEQARRRRRRGGKKNRRRGGEEEEERRTGEEEEEERMKEGGWGGQETDGSTKRKHALCSSARTASAPMTAWMTEAKAHTLSAQSTRAMYSTVQNTCVPPDRHDKKKKKPSSLVLSLDRQG